MEVQRREYGHVFQSRRHLSEIFFDDEIGDIECFKLAVGVEYLGQHLRVVKFKAQLGQVLERQMLAGKRFVKEARKNV